MTTKRALRKREKEARAGLGVVDTSMVDRLDADGADPMDAIDTPPSNAPGELVPIQGLSLVTLSGRYWLGEPGKSALYVGRQGGMYQEGQEATDDYSRDAIEEQLKGMVASTIGRQVYMETGLMVATDIWERIQALVIWGGDTRNEDRLGAFEDGWAIEGHPGKEVLRMPKEKITTEVVKQLVQGSRAAWGRGWEPIRDIESDA